MANVRYMGGNSATLGTKEIDANGIYNASSDDLDGYSSVTVDVPAPTGSISLEYTGNGQYSEDVSQYATADITVDVPIPTVNTQTKSITATTSQQTVTPDPGYLLDQVTVNPQQNTETYTPASDTASNDMGPVNNYRYVDTSGMILPTGSKTVTIDSNGNYTENVSDKATVDITVNVPVSGDLGTKTIITNGTYQALDDNLDGYSEVTVNVPQNATLGIKAITNNGSYNAITDGYDGFSRVDVNVQGAALQSSKTVTATTSQQTVTPDQGYDGLEQVIVDPQVHTQTYTPAENTAANDMGVNNNYRYVDTSGMYTPTSITPSNSSPATITDGAIYKANGNGKAISSLSEVAPSNAMPPEIYNGGIYKIKTRNGYLISTINIVVPSDSNPPLLSVDNSWYRLNGTSGYLYRTVQPKVKTGSLTTTAGTEYTIDCGFQPSKIFIYAYDSSNKFISCAYDENLISEYSWEGYRTSSSSANAQRYAFTSTSNGIITGITSNGFKWRGSGTFTTIYYVAIG